MVGEVESHPRKTRMRCREFGKDEGTRTKQGFGSSNQNVTRFGCKEASQWLEPGLDNLLTLGFKLVAAPGPSLPAGGSCEEWGARSWTVISPATCGISFKTNLSRSGKTLESKDNSVRENFTA